MVPSCCCCCVYRLPITFIKNQTMFLFSLSATKILCQLHVTYTSSLIYSNIKVFNLSGIPVLNKNKIAERNNKREAQTHTNVTPSTQHYSNIHIKYQQSVSKSYNKTLKFNGSVDYLKSKQKQDKDQVDKSS